MYIKILIIIISIAVGFFCKKLGLLTKKDGETILTKLVFYIFMPAAVFLSMSRVAISGDFFALPFTAAAIMIVCFAVSWFYTGWRKIENKTKGTAIIAAMTINTAMGLLPIFQLLYGDEGFARVAILDFSVAIITFSLVYFIAVHYGDEKNISGKIKQSLMKTVKFPTLWALILGISVNVLNISLPVLITDSLDFLSKPLVPMLLIALGLYFEPKLYKIKLLIPIIVMKIGVGLLIGFLMVWLFNLEGINRLVVLVASAAPSAYNTVVYSVKEKLDEDFAIAIVTATMIINIIAIFIILTVFV